jgi:anaerobic ribonucleoside-triphosphate reductase activating protein
MQIGKILYPVTTLGIGERLGIWTQGCNRFCRGCSNPELQTFDETKDVSPQAIFDATIGWEFNGVTISGGEPFLQAKDLKALVQLYSEAGVEDILVYTGFTLEELAAKKNEDIDYVLANISVLIDGPFVEALVDEVPLRGSSNQRVWVLNEKYQRRTGRISKKRKRWISSTFQMMLTLSAFLLQGMMLYTKNF